MIVLVSLIVLLRRLLVSTIFRMVHPYITVRMIFTLVSRIFVRQLRVCVNLRRCALPSRAEFSKDGFVFSSTPYTVQCRLGTLR